jgi:hypothetical protein
MKTFLSFLLFLVSFCFINSQVFAQSNSYQHGNVVYRIPSGYYQQTTGSLVVLVPQGQSLNNAEFAFTITPGINDAPRNLSGLLNNVVNQIEDGREIIHRQTKDLSSGNIRALAQTSISKDGNDTYITMYVAMISGSRTELFTVTTTNTDLLDKYTKQIGEFFSSLSFVNDKTNTSNSLAQNNSNRSSSNSRARNNNNQQLQRNRTYANQIFLNSITNNYNSLSRSIR